MCGDASTIDCEFDRERPDDFDGICEERHIGFAYPHPESIINFDYNKTSLKNI